MKKLRYVYLTLPIVTVLVLAGNVSPVIAADEWDVEGFNTPTLSGGLALDRYAAGLHVEWGHGSRDNGIPVDNLAARFIRDAWFDGETKRFSCRSGDGVRRIVDAWQKQQQPNTRAGRPSRCPVAVPPSGGNTSRGTANGRLMWRAL